MSNNKGLPPNVRKSMLDEALREGDGEVIDTPMPVIDTPTGVVAAVAAPTVTPDMASLIQALVTGITQANAGTAEAIRDALSNAATMAREPIPENKVDPGHSVYSHPDGDQVTPRTALRCPMFLGVYDEEGKSKPAFEIYEDTCTEAERVELNKLVPGAYPGIERNDGDRALWRVVLHSDDNGVPTRLVIAVPQGWLAQDQYQQMPGQLNFLRQLNAQQQQTAAA